MEQARIEISVDIDADRITQFQGRLIPAKQLPTADVKVESVINQWEQRVGKQVDIQIAIADKGVLIRDVLIDHNRVKGLQ